MKTHAVEVLLPASTHRVATCLKAAVRHFPASQIRGACFHSDGEGHDTSTQYSDLQLSSVFLREIPGTEQSSSDVFSGIL